LHWHHCISNFCLPNIQDIYLTYLKQQASKAEIKKFTLLSVSSYFAATRMHPTATKWSFRSTMSWSSMKKSNSLTDRWIVLVDNPISAHTKHIQSTK
jgi:hypothetical protein